MMVAVAGGTLYAAGTQAPTLEELLPTDERLTYRVGFSEFQVGSVEDDQRYLRWSIPNLLIENITAITEHLLSPAEKAAYRRRLLSDKRRELGAQLDAAIDSRDELFYITDFTVDTPQMIREAEQKIALERSRLMVLDQIVPTMIGLADHKPVEIIVDTDNDRLLSSERSIRQLQRSSDLDVVVTGRIEQQDTYLFVDLLIYNAITAQTYRAASVSAPIDDIAIAIAQLLPDVARAVLGRPWATLRVRNVPADSAVYFDDVPRGYGETDLEFVEHGRHTVRLERAGHTARATYILDLDPYEEREIYIGLSTPTQERIYMTSSPLGASVYLDSIWQGATPLHLARPVQEQTMTLIRDDYDAARTVLTPSAPSDIHIDLYPEGIDVGEFLILERDQFYGSLAVFAISAIPALVLYGIYEDRVQFANSEAFSEASFTERQDYLVDAEAILAFQRINTVLSVALLLNAIFELAGYIRAGDRYHIQ